MYYILRQHHQAKIPKAGRGLRLSRAAYASEIIGAGGTGGQGVRPHRARPPHGEFSLFEERR